MEERRSALINNPGEHTHCKDCAIIESDNEEDCCKFTAEVVAPIIAQGDPIGAVVICTKETNVTMGEMEVKLAETAARIFS
jgi:AbrB family transcriptional regulator (stage V sporulation protein T)